MFVLKPREFRGISLSLQSRILYLCQYSGLYVLIDRIMLVRYNSLLRALRAFPHSNYSSTPAAVAAAASSADNIPKASEISAKKASDDKPVQQKQKLVLAAFSSLKNIDADESLADDELNSKITSAETVQSLLSLSEAQGLSRNHALKIVSKLADWTSENKVKLVEFEGDPRFINLCRTLGHVVQGKSGKGKAAAAGGSTPLSSFSDLGVVLGVAGDDEAAKLVNTITVPQMIKVLSSLAYKKRRSIPLLRSLAFNIGKSSDELNIKDCADILYACAQLSYQDEVLFEKVCSDLCRCIHSNNKPAVVGSIITSLGLLKYKDKELLENICEWVMKNFSICRIQDLCSLVLTLATVNHIPVNGDELFQKLETHLQQSDVATPSLWLDIVWALVILNKAKTNQISSVLSEEFIDRLAGSQPDGLSIVSKLKLLNVNGAAKLLVDKYAGPLIELDSDITKVEVPRAKDKQAFVATVIDTLSNLLPSAIYMNTNINTGMGYIIDSECIVDSNLTPLPLVDKKTGKSIDRSQPGVRKGIKVAVLVLDYHDVTKGEADPVGIASLAIRLTERSGYKTIVVPYYEFNPRDKLVTRVQYLEQQLKNIIKSSSNNNNNNNNASSPAPIASHPPTS